MDLRNEAIRVITDVPYNEVTACSVMSAPPVPMLSRKTNHIKVVQTKGILQKPDKPSAVESCVANRVHVKTIQLCQPAIGVIPLLLACTASNQKHTLHKAHVVFQL